MAGTDGGGAQMQEREGDTKNTGNGEK